MTNKYVFRPRARLLLQLGEQLIRNESIAFLELVKNSYDADATDVIIQMEAVDNTSKGMILIDDNGEGMDIDIIKNVWMEPGSDHKEILFQSGKRTQKYKRLPLGEKGIGRFGAHKLGQVIELITRMKNGPEIYLKIDWTKFAEKKYLDDVPISIHERTPEIFKGRMTGTRIIITKLRSTWNRRMIREVYRSVNSLCSPFDAPDSFRVLFDLDKKEWIEGLFSWEEAQKYSLFKISSELEGQQIKKFKYEFTPWDSMTKVKYKKITEKDDEVKKNNEMVYQEDRKSLPIDLSTAGIGKIRFEALIFDRDTRILSLGVEDKIGLKQYLDENGGIRVYRDGVRVYDYGEPGNDWLGLGIRRVNVPTVRISNNLIVGAVHIEREESEGLTEKTNREGFIENQNYEIFKKAVLYVLRLSETLRNIDKDYLRTFYGPTPMTQPVLSSLDNLRSIVDKKIKDEKLREEISDYLMRIENDYKYINETLLRSAGAGLNLSVVIHEIEKIINELSEVVKKHNVSSRIVSLVKRLSDLIEGYSIILRSSGRKNENIKNLVDQALFDIEFRLQAHKINVIKSYSDFRGNLNVRCARNLIVGSLLNIFDNSIWWLNYGKVEKKKIYISIEEGENDFLYLIIADNGPGFALPVEEIVKPFVSSPAKEGMGLGLHIASEVMESHRGELLFPDKGDFTMPSEFKSGAVIALGFRRKETK